MKFSKLGLGTWVDERCERLKFNAPTPIQRACIPLVLAGKDVVGRADTGSGKTCCYVLPILQALSLNPYGVFALVVLPTRELCSQVVEQVRGFGAGVGTTIGVVVGGGDALSQCRQIARRPHIVVGTPGRLAALVEHDQLLPKSFARLKVVVFDEADRLADESMGMDLEKLLGVLPKHRQTLAFSATLPHNEVSLKVMLERLGTPTEYAPCIVDVGLKSEVPDIQQFYLFLPSHIRPVYLSYLLSNKFADEQGIIFAATCRTCEILLRTLRRLSLSVTPLHGALGHHERAASLSEFRSEKKRVLICTDLGARGLDIPKVNFVVNYDVPDPTTFVHRVGRTGRAGRKGLALSFVTQSTGAKVTAIENQIGTELKELELDENAVLAGLSKTTKAEQEAVMSLHDSEFEGRLQKLQEQRKVTRQRVIEKRRAHCPIERTPKRQNKQM